MVIAKNDRLKFDGAKQRGSDDTPCATHVLGALPYYAKEI